MGFLQKQAEIYKSMVIERGENKKGSFSSIEEQTNTMRKSIYAYWTVFCFRYVDNLHQRIKHNLLFDFADKIILIIGQLFMPNGGSEYSERVKQWMNEPREMARHREELCQTLDKIDKCLVIVNEMGQYKRT